MSFDKELRVVMISSIGIFVYLIAASAIMLSIYLNFGETPFYVAWLIVLIIPINFALCSFICIVFYRKKERKFNAIKEHLNKLSDLALEVDQKREEKIHNRIEEVPATRRAKLSTASSE